jgi:hypothetical protein
MRRLIDDGPLELRIVKGATHDANTRVAAQHLLDPMAHQRVKTAHHDRDRPVSRLAQLLGPPAPLITCSNPDGSTSTSLSHDRRVAR